MNPPRTLDADKQATLSTALQRHTCYRVSMALGLSREPLLKLASGVPVTPGVVALVLTVWPALEALDAVPSHPTDNHAA